MWIALSGTGPALKLLTTMVLILMRLKWPIGVDAPTAEATHRHWPVPEILCPT